MMLFLLLSLVMSLATGNLVAATLWPLPSDRLLRELAVRWLLAAVVGFASASLSTFIWLHLQPGNLTALATIDFLLLASAWWWWQRAQKPKSSKAQKPEIGTSQLAKVLLGLALLASSTAVLVHEGLLIHQRPHGHWDAPAIWNLKARFFFRGGEYWTDMFTSHLDWTRPDHPPLLPLNVARWWQYGGGESTLVPALTGVALTILIAALLGFAVATLSTTVRGCLAALALLSTSFFAKHATSQYADHLMALLILATFVAIALARAGHGRAGLFVLAGFAAGAACWAKNEGALFFTCTMGTVGIWRLSSVGAWQGGRDLTAMLAGSAPFLVVLAIWKMGYYGRNDLLDRSFGQLITVAVNAPIQIHQAIGQQFRAAILTVPDRAVLLAISVYALCTGFEKSRLGLLGSGGVILIAMVAAYYLIFLTAPGDPEALMNASVSRLFFQLWPTSIFLLMANLRRFPLRQPSGN